MWRDSDGVAHVWEDRCPHRGMRLSLGFVRGDQIACLYHGWRYDAAGQCRYIPAHPQLTPPETIRVPVLAVGGADGDDLGAKRRPATGRAAAGRRTSRR